MQKHKNLRDLKKIPVRMQTVGLFQQDMQGELLFAMDGVMVHIDKSGRYVR